MESIISGCKGLLLTNARIVQVARQRLFRILSGTCPQASIRSVSPYVFANSPPNQHHEHQLPPVLLETCQLSLHHEYQEPQCLLPCVFRNPTYVHSLLGFESSILNARMSNNDPDPGRRRQAVQFMLTFCIDSLFPKPQTLLFLRYCSTKKP